MNFDSSFLDVGNTSGIALLVKSRVPFNTATVVINTAQARGAVVRALGSRGSIDFNAALSVITPPAVTLSRVSGKGHAVIDFFVARLAWTDSDRAGNEESSDKEESLELLSHF